MPWHEVTRDMAKEFVQEKISGASGTLAERAATAQNFLRGVKVRELFTDAEWEALTRRFGNSAQ